MNSNITIAVIGGTGKSGTFLVSHLLDQGFQVKVLVRNAEKINQKQVFLDIIEGSVTDYNAVHTLIAGCDAVISTLGLGIPASEPYIFSKSTTHILQAMQYWQVNR
jgi:putative NADH-flavin reductase